MHVASSSFRVDVLYMPYFDIRQFFVASIVAVIFLAVVVTEMRRFAGNTALSCWYPACIPVDRACIRSNPKPFSFDATGGVWSRGRDWREVKREYDPGIPESLCGIGVP
jgi:hypothetical protein